MKNLLHKNILALVLSLFVYSAGFADHDCNCQSNNPCDDTTGNPDCTYLCTQFGGFPPPGSQCPDPIIPIDQNILYLAGAALILGAYTIIKKRKRPTEI